jgi:hypothetical protein
MKTHNISRRFSTTSTTTSTPTTTNNTTTLLTLHSTHNHRQMTFLATIRILWRFLIVLTSLKLAICARILVITPKWHHNIATTCKLHGFRHSLRPLHHNLLTNVGC